MKEDLDVVVKVGIISACICGVICALYYILSFTSNKGLEVGACYVASGGVWVKIIRDYGYKTYLVEYTSIKGNRVVMHLTGASSEIERVACVDDKEK